jgi:hypothetical protein
MNNLKALGCIFLLFGFICLVVGLSAGYSAANANPDLNSVNPQAGQALFMAAFQDYGIISLFMFAIAAVGLYTGSTNSNVQPNVLYYEPKHSQSIGIQFSQEPPQPNATIAEPPQPKTLKCPSCGQNSVFIEQYGRWYCPNEGRYIYQPVG